MKQTSEEDIDKKLDKIIENTNLLNSISNEINNLANDYYVRINHLIKNYSQSDLKKFKNFIDEYEKLIIKLSSTENIRAYRTSRSNLIIAIDKLYAIYKILDTNVLSRIEYVNDYEENEINEILGSMKSEDLEVTRTFTQKF